MYRQLTVNNAPVKLNIQTLLSGRQWFHSSFLYIIIIIIANMTAGSLSQHPQNQDGCFRATTMCGYKNKQTNKKIYTNNRQIHSLKDEVQCSRMCKLTRRSTKRQNIVLKRAH